MKKLLFLIICLCLCACQSNSDELNDEQLQKYNEYKEAIINNGGSNSYGIPFDYEMSVEKVDDAYSYTIIIKNPTIYLNDISIMAYNTTLTSEKDMCLSVGIIDNEKVSMIPNQSDEDKGFPKGIALNGESKASTFQIYCVVDYFNEDNTVESRKFFTFTVIDGKLSGESNE